MLLVKGDEALSCKERYFRKIEDGRGKLSVSKEIGVESSRATNFLKKSAYRCHDSLLLVIVMVNGRKETEPQVTAYLRIYISTWTEPWTLAICPPVFPPNGKHICSIYH